MHFTRATWEGSLLSDDLAWSSDVTATTTRAKGQQAVRHDDTTT